jgi:hypothetical protein
MTKQFNEEDRVQRKRSARLLHMIPFERPTALRHFNASDLATTDLM